MSWLLMLVQTEGGRVDPSSCEILSLSTKDHVKQFYCLPLLWVTEAAEHYTEPNGSLYSL